MGHLISFINSLIDNWQWTLYFVISFAIVAVVYWRGGKE